jgi:hypothetical protein
MKLIIIENLIYNCETLCNSEIIRLNSHEFDLKIRTIKGLKTLNTQEQDIPQSLQASRLRGKSEPSKKPAETCGKLSHASACHECSL